MIYNWLLMDMFLYTSMIYLSLFIHILVGTRLLIKKENQKNTSPPHFSFQNPIVYRAFRKGGVQQRGHSTPHLTPPLFYSTSILFPNLHFQKSDEGESLRRKSDLLSEVLSEVFGKHLTLRNSSKQRLFRQKSEVVRSFLSSAKNDTKKEDTPLAHPLYKMVLMGIIP
jgi:hypothetical protein